MKHSVPILVVALYSHVPVGFSSYSHSDAVAAAAGIVLKDEVFFVSTSVVVIAGAVVGAADNGQGGDMTRDGTVVGT